MAGLGVNNDSDKHDTGSQPAGNLSTSELEELARKVVELLLREMKLENERSGKY